MDNYSSEVKGKVAELKDVALRKMMEEIKLKRDQYSDLTESADVNIVNSKEEQQKLESYILESHFAWIDEHFERAAAFPDPQRSENPIYELSKICGDEDSVITVDKGESADIDFVGSEGCLDDLAFNQVFSIKDSVSGWKAGAADSFRNQFLTVIPDVVVNQINIARSMRNIIAANQAIIEQSREDTLTLLNNTITAIEYDDGCCAGDDDFMTTLKIVGGLSAIIAGGVSIYVSGGTSSAIVAGGFSMLSGAISTYDSANSGDSKQVSLSADTVDGVLENMKEGLTEIYSSFDDANDKFKNEYLAGAVSAMSDVKQYFVAPRPVAFAEATRDNVRDVVESDLD